MKFKQDPLNAWFPIEHEDEHNHTLIETDNDNEQNGTLIESEDDTRKNNDTDKTNKTADAEDKSDVQPGNMSEASYPRYIYVYYTTADETTYSSDLIVDFPSFISAIGGNLGLFLGFSFLGILFPFYDWIEERFLRSKNELVNIVKHVTTKDIASTKY